MYKSLYSVIVPHSYSLNYWCNILHCIPITQVFFGLKMFLSCVYLSHMHQKLLYLLLYLGSVQSLSRVWLFATPWTAARLQASLSITNSWNLLRLMSIESVMPPNHLILCQPLLLPPSTFPSIRAFSNDQFFAGSEIPLHYFIKLLKGKK